MTSQTLKRQAIHRRARTVATSACSRKDVICFFNELIDQAEQRLISVDDAAYGIAFLIPHSLVLYDDELNDIATLASQFEIPKESLAYLKDRGTAFLLLKRLVRETK